MFHCFSGLLRWLVRRCCRRSVKAAVASVEVNGRQYRVIRNFNGQFMLRTGLDYDLANDKVDIEQPGRFSCWGFANKDYARTECTEETASPDLSEDGMSEELSQEGGPQPRTIFHALHLTFDDIRRILPELAWKGFDAIQIPPAQVSPNGDLRRDWYLRYQPVNYQHIDLRLGGAESLQRLCEEASGHGMTVIADCVFNHMAVVASCAEWQEAQHNGHKMEELQQRLDRTFGPHLDRHDFQWPWVCLEGEKWDDPHYMFEGWGCGEWSELRFSEKVIAQHLQHLRMLLNCGVTGFRLDAAKHMRPEHVARYVDFIHGEGAFVYAEVLSMDKHLHAQYEKLGRGVPSTDFLLAADLAKAWRAEDAGSISAQLQACEHLGSNSIQFVRNHDTMLNDGSICGIDWSSAEEASLAWAHLIARNEGTILMHQDDIHVPLIHAALSFRSDLSSLAASQAPYALKTELAAWPPPSYQTIAMLLTLAECPVGLAIFNTTNHEQTMDIPWQLNSYSLQEVKAPSSHNDHMQAGCSPSHLDKRLPPRMARFFLLECFSGPLIQPNPEIRYMTLFYFSGWESPHIHFCVEHVWTRCPGWSMRKCDKPAVQGFKLPRAGHHGRWWRVDVPLRMRCSVEFVLNDGGHSWDNHPSALGNYIAEMPGLHILVNKKLAMGSTAFSASTAIGFVSFQLLRSLCL